MDLQSGGTGRESRKSPTRILGWLMTHWTGMNINNILKTDGRFLEKGKLQSLPYIIGCNLGNLLCQAMLLIFVFQVVLQEAQAQTAPTKIVTLPSGEKYQFAGVTYGPNHAPEFDPHPLDSNQTNDWSLRVWFRLLGVKSPRTEGFQLIKTGLADQNGVLAGKEDEYIFFRGGSLCFATFEVAPRRSPILQFCIFQPDGTIQGKNEIDRVSFPNPYFGKFSEWKPEPFPMSKKVGDVDVRLVNLMTGIELSGRPPVLANGKQGIDFRPAKNRMDLATFFDVSLNSERGINEEWVVQNAELSDATGNILASPSNEASSGDNVSPMTFMGEYRLSIPGTLWPDEAAWRLKLELKRKSGFAPREFVTFKNVPVPKIGMAYFSPVTNTADGMQIVLKEFVENGDRTNIRYPSGTNASYFVNDHTPETMVAVELPDHPEGVAVDFVKMVADIGETFEKHGNSWKPFYRGASLKFIPTNAQTVDITWVVQKMRSVEFLVKPPL